MHRKFRQDEPTEAPVCSGCGIAPVAQDKPLDWFMGKYVKRRFPVTAPVLRSSGQEVPNPPDAERMWVLVTGINRDKDQLIGILNSSPLFECGIVPGDVVRFKKSEVIGVES